MVINMLKAISQMLNRSNEVGKNTMTSADLEYIAKVNCAKIMLDEIIKGMEPTTTLISKPLQKEELPKKEEVKYRVIVSKDQTIAGIENLPRDGKVKLNGVVMTHKEVIGQTYGTTTTLEIL